MKFEHYLKKLYESQEYKKFRKKYKDEYLCAGFFVLDFETGQDLHQIDYLLPNNKVATFFLDKGVKMKISDQTLKKELPKIKPKAKTDLDALKGIIEDEMKNRTVTEKIRKMIAILHIMDDKLIWNIQCILDGLGILLVHVDDSDQTVLKFEKHSLMELIKPMSTGLEIIPKSEEKGKVTIKELEKLQEMLKAAKSQKSKISGAPKTEKFSRKEKQEKDKKKK